MAEIIIYTGKEALDVKQRLKRPFEEAVVVKKPAPPHTNGTANGNVVMPEMRYSGPPEEYLDRFGEVYERYRERIYRSILRLVASPEQAEELTQDTFLRAYSGLPKINNDLIIGSWLYRIATNLCMDHLRKSSLIKWENIADTPPSTKGLIARENPVVDVLRHAEGEMVHTVLAKLPPKERVLLVLRNQELSCSEIGEIVGISRSAVKSALFRARQNFKTTWFKMYGPYMG